MNMTPDEALAVSGEAEAILHRLGHVHQPDTHCRARVKPTPAHLRPPGPANPPMWCCLKEGHEGPHRFDHGGMHPSIPFRDTDEVEYRQPSCGDCAKCGEAWPCETARAITVKVPNVVREVLTELSAAMAKFPTWPTDPLHASGVVAEEAGELFKAVLQQVYEPHKNKPGDVRKEAIQTAAMAIRFIASMGAYEFKPGPQHEQPMLAATPGADGEGS